MDWTDEQVETLRRVLNAAGIDMDNLVETIKKICEAMVIYCTEFEEAMVRIANMVRAGAADVTRKPEELAAVLEEKGELLELPNTRDRKEARARRNAFERANAARFSQYKVKELSWKQRQGKRKHWRKWRGADRT